MIWLWPCFPEASWICLTKKSWLDPLLTIASRVLIFLSQVLRFEFKDWRQTCFLFILLYQNQSLHVISTYFWANYSDQPAEVTRKMVVIARESTPKIAREKIRFRMYNSNLSRWVMACSTSRSHDADQSKLAANGLGLKNLGNTCYVSWVDESRGLGGLFVLLHPPWSDVASQLISLIIIHIWYTWNPNVPYFGRCYP